MYLGTVGCDVRGSGFEVGTDEGDAPYSEMGEIGVVVVCDEFLDFLGEGTGGRSTEEVIEGEHGVGFAAAKVGLQVDDGACAGVSVEK